MEELSPFAQSVQERRQPMAMTVADALREAIFRGALKSGEPLRQDAIAKQFGVSQVTVREALRLLGEEGVVDIIPRRGAFVSSLSPDDVDEIVELRITLETLLVARAIPRLDAEDLRVAETISRKLDKARTLNDQLELNLDFHKHLYAKSGRPRTLATLDRLRLAFEPYLRLLWARSAYKAQSQTDHREILALCKAGDVKKAQALLAAHITKTGVEIRALLTETGKGPLN